jgi:hypothetical protein
MPLCFIIYGRYYGYCGKSFVDYLRCTYQNCKVACYFGDLIETHSWEFTTNLQYFDIAFSFDKKDALSHGIFFFEEPFSIYNIKKDPLVLESDVTFIGSAKDRLKDILCVYDILRKNGLICDFHITGVEKQEQVYPDKISYNKRLTFFQVLQHVISSKCILEIVQKNENSPTTRISEAIAYGKKLLSNCSELMEKPYYNPSYISIFNDPNDIDINFLKRNIKSIDYSYIENLSPLNLTKAIGNKLDLYTNSQMGKNMNIDIYLTEIESLGRNSVFEKLYLWPNTPIQNNLQDEIIQKVGASDYEIANPVSRTNKVIKELKYLLKSGKICQNFSVLDIACGDAVLLTQIKNIYPNCNAYGIDCNKDKFETHKTAYNVGCKIFCGYIQHLFEPQETYKIKFDVVIMFNTYRGWEHAQLRDDEKNLPGLADEYFVKNAQYTILTATRTQIEHFNQLGFFVKILGYGEYNSIMIIISKKRQFVHFNKYVILKYKIYAFMRKIAQKVKTFSQ